MEEVKRKGRQTPTQSFVIPYQKTFGQEAVNIYNSSGRTAQEWQELLLYDILSITEDGLYMHMKFGYSVPRRNGKNEVIVMREMYGLVKGEKILHTAHRTTTTHAAWDRLYSLLKKSKIQIQSVYRAYGKEHIELTNGGKIEFRTRTTKGGLGEGFDLLVIDEAQEYEDNQETALKYVVSDSFNPQTIFCGTPPTPVSNGTVFTKMREDVFAGNTKNTGWAEWSVDRKSDVYDKELWYQCNPSLGVILTERKIENEISRDFDDFNIQRLGLWMKYNLKSVISVADWESLKELKMPSIRGKLHIGIKFGKDGTNVAMSIAVKTYSEKIFIETLDCQPIRAGNNWIIKFLKSSYIDTVTIDGQSGQTLLFNEIKDCKIKHKIILPSVKEVIAAHSIFEQALYNKKISHMNQPSLMNSATNCEKRLIGTTGGWGYQSIKAEADIVLLDSCVLAHWQCVTSKEKKKQQARY